MANMSEDALFKALLKNKPPQQPPKPPVVQNEPKKEVPRPVPVAQHVEKSEIQEELIEKRLPPPVKPLDLEPVVDSINRLNSSVNMIYGIMKNIMVPVLVLILVISIAILVKSK